MDVIRCRNEMTTEIRRTIGESILRSASASRLKRKPLHESVLHLYHLQLGCFEDPVVNARQWMFPASHGASFDVAAVPFHCERPGRPHWPCCFNSIGDVQETMHGNRAGRQS